MGAEIIGANGDSIGDVSDLVLDSSNQVSDIIVDAGGFLGIGSQSVALPASDLQISQDADGNMQVSTNLTESELEQMGEYQDIEGDDYRLYSAEPVETDTDKMQ